MSSLHPKVIDDIHEQHAEVNNAPGGRVNKPRTKPARSIRLEMPLNASGKGGIVRLTVGKDTGDYYLDRVPADFGLGFKVEEIGGDEVYHVNLDGQVRTCDCKGHARHGHCKHSDGLAKLLELGKIANTWTSTAAA
jgi:hypothetical protein